jgi:S-adenosylmethionine decarboxylase
MTPAIETFGVHLMLDGYDADPRLLRDEAHLLELLRDLPGRLGMHAIAAPQVVEVGPLNRKDPGGLSGFVLIAESHISFHTFPRRRFVTADLYTCQPSIDRERVVALLTDAFGIGSVEVYTQDRGVRYPSANVA